MTELFTQAADLSGKARAAFLEQACAGDTELRREIESLLAAQTIDVDFLDDPKSGGLVPLTPLPASDRVGTYVGPYRIESIIASGGMGTVYRAVQDQPHRTVAVKVLRMDFVSPGALRRFEFESELLGRLQHPGIAEIHAAGVFEENGRSIPYFALEYIPNARPITTYVRDLNLGIHEQLELFVQVCDAVQCAHQQGVIHRDLKPDNILVGDGGQPKVIDFGVARARATDDRVTLQTQAGQLVGTLAYMSPEQVSGNIDAVDTRSDVYAMGILLYEMLSRQRPLNLANKSLFQAIQIIKEHEPTRLGATVVQCKGDIETIVAKALEKDRARRYESAAELAADIRRYLNDEPIHARPQTTLYQLRKLARRNRGLFGGVSVAALALIVSLVVTVNQAVQAVEARKQAQLQEVASERYAYRASVNAAVMALENHDVALARRSLEGAPQAWRGWEWNHLHSRLDHAAHRFQTEVQSQTTRAVFLDSERIVVTSGQTSNRIDLTSGAIASLNPGINTAVARGHTVSFADGIFTVHDHEANTRTEITMATLGLTGNRPRFNVSPDGRWLGVVSRSADGARCVRRDLRTGWSQAMPLIAKHNQTRVVIANSGLAAITLQNTAQPHVWPLASSDDPEPQVVILERAPHQCLSLNFDAAAERVVGGFRNGTVAIWSTEGALLAVESTAHGDAVRGVAFSPDGQLVASAGADRSLRIWRSNSLAPLAVLHGHASGLVGVAFGPSGLQLASIDAGGMLRVWDVTTHTPGVLGKHDSIVFPLAYSSDGSVAATAGWDNVIRLWDTHQDAPLGTLRGHDGTIMALAFAPHNHTLVSLGQDGLRSWSLDHRTSLAHLSADVTGQPPATVKHISFDADGLHVPLPWTFDQAHVGAFDVRKGERVTLARKHLDGLYAESPNGRYLVNYASEATTRGPRSARADTACVVEVVDQLEDVVLALPELSGPFGFDPTRPARLAARERNQATQVSVWDLVPGRRPQRVGVLLGHTDDIYSIAFSPDGRRIATAGRDSLRVWDAATFEEVIQLRGHRSFVWFVAFSPDGRQLLSTSGDFTVRRWNTWTGEHHPASDATTLADRLKHSTSSESSRASVPGGRP